jgi:hypothetical protein
LKKVERMVNGVWARQSPWARRRVKVKHGADASQVVQFGRVQGVAESIQGKFPVVESFQIEEGALVE